MRRLVIIPAFLGALAFGGCAMDDEAPMIDAVNACGKYNGGARSVKWADDKINATTYEVTCMNGEKLVIR